MVAAVVQLSTKERVSHTLHSWTRCCEWNLVEDY